MKTSKFFSVILIIAILTTSFLSVNSSGLGSTPVDSGFEKYRKLSKAEIIDLVADENITDHMNFYTAQPSVTSPYSMGNVRSDIQQAALNRMNSYRRLAGLDPVSINNKYTKLAQAASVVNAANDIMTHYPSKPADMPDDLYNDGATGACQSNIACYIGYRPETGPLSFSVDMWMEDSDASNIDRLGHRRWILNPTMKSTGFGCATATSNWVHTAMYAFDTSAYCYDYNYISWPPSGYMANDTDFFTPIHAWSVSLSPDVYNTNSLSKVEVELKDSRGNEWEFEGDEDDDGFFNVDLGGYGCNRNAIIFRPDGIEKYEGKYTVTIEGLKTKSNAPTTLTFEVDFFNSKKTEETEPTTAPTTTEPTTDKNPTFSDSIDELDKFLVDLGIRYDFSALMDLMYHLDFGGTLESWVFSNYGPTTKIPEVVLSIPTQEISMHLWFAIFEIETTTEPTTIPTTSPTKTTEPSTSPTTTTPPTEQITPGDTNGDGKVNASDARAALRISAQLDIPTKEQLIASDVNGDGRVNASDARKILRVSAQLEKL